MNRQLRILTATLLVAVGSLCAGAAHANNLIILLVRSSLGNANDPGSSPTGLWQYEGGAVENASTGATIGHYITNRRVTYSGTSTDNAAGMTTTLFFSNATAGDAPNNMTLEGAWSFTSGQFTGSISAASSRYRLLIGTDATMTSPSSGTTKLVIDWIGQEAVP